MIIHEGTGNLNLINPVVTVGVFDGVHLGHKALLDHLVSRSERAGGESAVITFDPHPRVLLSGKTGGFFFLSTLDEKKKLFAETGIGHLIIMNFTRELASMEADEFIRQILVGEIGTRHLLVGYDNHFGKGRGGYFDKISESAGKYGLKVEQVGGVSSSAGIISSTSIRDTLINGRIVDANRWLGYDYSVTGKVVRGRGLGRSLGFPTANILRDDPFKLIPANGVYAVEVLLGNERLPGMMSIGFNPTVNKKQIHKSIEVNIFDVDRDLYGHYVTVIFRFWLRDEKKFESKELLSEQMKLDRESAMKLIG